MQSIIQDNHAEHPESAQSKQPKVEEKKPDMLNEIIADIMNEESKEPAQKRLANVNPFRHNLGLSSSSDYDKINQVQFTPESDSPPLNDLGKKKSIPGSSFPSSGLGNRSSLEVMSKSSGGSNQLMDFDVVNNSNA